MMTIDLLSLCIGAALTLPLIIFVVCRFRQVRSAYMDLSQQPAQIVYKQEPPVTPAFIQGDFHGATPELAQASRDKFKRELADAFTACGEDRPIVFIPSGVTIDFE
jgi:hypothetical protein